jgi:hypothetical protein
MGRLASIIAVLVHCHAHELQGLPRALGDPQLPIPVEVRLLLFVQRRHRHRARAGLPVVHQLREGRGRHSNEGNGAAVVERALPRTRAMTRGVDSEAATKSSRAVTMEESFSSSM